MKYVNPTNDLALKKVLGNNDNLHILAGFIKDFLFIDPKGLIVENPYSIKAYRELLKDEEAYKLRLTISDIAAVMDFADYTSELQIRKESYFDERSLYYPLNKFVSRYKIVPNETSAYARLRPIYAMNILGYNHFPEDEDALRIFELYDPARNKHFPQKLLNLGYFELLKPNVETENQKHWQDYFMQRPLAGDAPQYIQDALHIIDMANMNEEEVEAMTKVEYYQSIYDNQIDYAHNEGLNKGRNEGRNEERLLIAKKLLANNSTIDTVVECTGLSYEEVEQLLDM